MKLMQTKILKHEELMDHHDGIFGSRGYVGARPFSGKKKKNRHKTLIGPTS